MLNGDLKDEALKKLKAAEKHYNQMVDKVKSGAMELLQLRHSSSHIIIAQVEEYINTLSNSPKEFDRSYVAYKNEFHTFNQVLHKLELENKKSNISTTAATAGGVAAGVGVAAFAPTAAMAVASTFGVASTGTAISALGGAAATNAALAWLGGGALAAGGGGMAAGNALLALAGPVGWAIGGAAIVGGSLWKRKKNAEIAEQATKETKVLNRGIAELRTAEHEVSRLLDLTQTHVGGVKELLDLLKSSAPEDYQHFDQTQKAHLGSLINHIQSLSALLNKKAI
ncbi:hypothetical protein [Endozoicomonas ascidiicola]|uniref:hypothetical protein n=1 Tax=Endozoicomonas ascidiicola TaxID=1698521 RepID=UPI000833A9E4|nr:hypothetical protein [Endozoicomonas ascidiicola]